MIYSPFYNGNPLCQVFLDSARQAWHDMEDSYTFGMTLGEETITDYLLLGLRRAAPLQIILKKFNKREEGRTTGADWEWWFVRNNRGFGMRIQAKKLNPISLRYEDLNHIVRKTRQKQINLLISDAKAQTPHLYAAYCFYNYVPKAKSLPAWLCNTYPPDHELFGCTICDAHLIRSCINSKVDDLHRVAQLSFPWTCLVCCAGFSQPHAHLPDRVYRNVQELSRLGGGAFGAGLKLPSKRQIVPPPVDPLPDYVVRALVNEGDSFEPPATQSNRAIDGILIVRELE